MQIADIHNLTNRLVAEDWIVEFGEDENEAEEFADWLKEMYERADEDVDALYSFFVFITNEQGSSGAVYNWDSKEFKTRFCDSYRGGGTDVKSVLRDYYESSEDDVLAPLVADRHVGDYFDWVGYTKDQRPDLTIAVRGAYFYLFEGE